MEAAIRKGRDLPEWFLEEPPLLLGDQFYLDAFWALSTERHIGMAVGPIPWSRATDYAVRAGLDEDMIGPFVKIISVMDGAWLEWSAKEHAKRAPRPKPPASAAPRGRRRG